MNHFSANTQTAMMAAIDLPDGTADVPEWVHLLPAARTGQLVKTADARGPYFMGDAAEIIAASFASSDALEVDVNHATFVAAPQGGRSDAVGWVREMQAREDGVWGRVEWTPEGQRLVAEKAYRKISPVIIHDLKKNILRIANISLVNRPNLRGLVALNQETSMNLHALLAEKLGLPADSTEAALIAAVPAPATATALQSAITEIGLALGVEGGDGAAILTAAKTRAKAQPDELAAMQTELTSVAAELNTLKASGKKAAAETFVDKAIGEARAGVKPQRDRFIAMHMADPAGTEALIGGLPALGGGIQSTTTPSGEVTSLNAEQVRTAELLGIPQDKYLATLKAERKETN